MAEKVDRQRLLERRPELNTEGMRKLLDSPSVRAFQPPEPEPEPDWQSGGALQDIGVGLAAGASRIPSTIAGIGDYGFGLTMGALESAGRAFGDESGADRASELGNARPWSSAFGALGEATGFQPREWGEELREERYSPQMLEQRENVDAAWEQAGEQWGSGDRLGAAGTVAGSYLRNPRTIQALVTESVPETVLGGLAARPIAALGGTRAVSGTGTQFTPASGAAREASRATQRIPSPLAPQGSGRIQAAQRTNRLSPAMAVGLGQVPLYVGQSMAEIDEDVDYDRAVLASTAAGLGGFIFGTGSAKFAERVGLTDPETAISRLSREVGNATPSRRPLPLRMAGGAIAEGILQEAPQEGIQQMSINWAENKPLFENVPRGMVEGMLAGGVLGAGANIRRSGSATPTDLTGGTQDQPDTPPGTPSTDASQQGPNTPALLGEYRGLNTVVNNLTDTDQINTALERMRTLRSQLEDAGVPESALTEELARGRYQELNLRKHASLLNARQLAARDPGKAQEIMQRIPEMQREIDALEDMYGSDRLTSAGLQAALELRDVEGTEGYFRKDGRLNKRADDYLTNLLSQDPQELRTALVDSEARNRRQDQWRPLEDYALRKMGLNPQEIVTEANAFGEAPGTEPPASPEEAPRTPPVQPGSATPTNLMGFSTADTTPAQTQEETALTPAQTSTPADTEQLGFSWDDPASSIDYNTAQSLWERAGDDRSWDSLTESEQAFVGSRLRDAEQSAIEQESEITEDDLQRAVNSASTSMRLASRTDLTQREQEIMRALMNIDHRTVDTDGVLQRVGDYLGVSRQQISKDLSRLLRRTRSDNATPKQFLEEFFSTSQEVPEGAETLVATTDTSEDGGERGGDLSVIESVGQSQTGSGPRADAQALVTQITNLPDEVSSSFLSENARLIDRAQQDTADGRRATKELRKKVKAAVKSQNAIRSIEQRLSELPETEAARIRSEHADRIRIADPEGNKAAQAAHRTVQSEITKAVNRSKRESLQEEDRQIADENMRRAAEHQRAWLESPYGATVETVWESIVSPAGILPTGPEDFRSLDPQSGAIIVSRVAEVLNPQLGSMRTNEELLEAARRATENAIRELSGSDVLSIRDKDGVTYAPADIGQEQAELGTTGEDSAGLPSGDVSGGATVLPAEQGRGEGPEAAPAQPRPEVRVRTRRRPRADPDAPDLDVATEGAQGPAQQSGNALRNTQTMVQALVDAEQSATGNVQQVIDAVRQAAAPEMRTILDTVVAHPSLRGLRFSTRDTDGLDRTHAAYGIYDPATHVVWMNVRAFAAAADPDTSYTIGRQGTPDQAMVETFVHELLHAVTRDAIVTSVNTGSELDTQMQGIQRDISEWLANTDKSELSERVVQSLNIMTTNPSEVVTYGMTSPEVQDVLRQIRSSQNDTSLWTQFIEAIRFILNLPNQYRSVLEDVVQVTDRAMDQNPQPQQQIVQKWRRDLEGVISATTPREIAEQSIALAQLAVDNVDRQVLSDRLSTLLAEYEDAPLAERIELESQIRDEAGRVIRVMAREDRARNTGREDAAAFDVIAEDYRNSYYNRVYEAAPPKLKNAMRSTKNTVKRLGLATMFSSDVAALVRKYIPQAPQYFASINRRIAYRNRIHVQIQQVAEPVANWPSERRKIFNNFLMESTYAEAWGFQPDWMPDATVDPAMQEKFEQLEPHEQEVAVNMFRLAHQMHRQAQDTIRANIEATYNNLLEKTRSPKKQIELERERDRELASHDRKQRQFRNAYLPLKRWGEWAVVYKSDRFREAERSRDRRLIDELKADENHYQVYFTTSEYEALNLRDTLRENGINADQPFPRMRYDEQNELIPYDLLQRLREEAMSQAETSRQGEAIWRAVEKLYIQSLSETASRKSELRRMKIHGADHDMTRAFIEHGMSLAALQSALEINKDTRSILQEMKDSATDPDKPASTRPERMMALNEILARHALSLDYDPKPWERKVMSATSVWMLLSSPAYFIQNATQVMMLTFPHLASRFGANRAMSNIIGAYNDVAKGVRSTHDQELLNPESEQFSVSERALLHRLLDHGLLDVGIAADLGSLQDAHTRTGQFMNRIHRGMVTGVRYIEVFNRATSALAAYRLREVQLRSENPGMSDADIAQQAQDYAYETVSLTQGDYGGPNAPRAISLLPMGRLVTQFRKFQLIQIGVLARSFHAAFSRKPVGVSELEWRMTRSIARKHLGYIMGVHGAVGGLMGLPAANIIGYALAKAFGDEDEPDNAELLARRFIGDKETADLILRGFPAWAGIDSSTRLGMGLTFSWLPFTDLDMSKDGAMVVLGSLLGPAAGLTAKGFDGAGMYLDGDPLGGVARMMPKGVEDLYKAVSYSTDGIRTRRGDLALSADELDMFDIVTQGLGWPSKTITDRFMASGALWDVEAHFSKRTSRIKRAFVEAHDRGDARAKRAAIDEWIRLQSKRREYGVGDPQPVSWLMRSITDRDERERSFVQGVQTTDTNRTFVEGLFE